MFEKNKYYYKKFKLFIRKEDKQNPNRDYYSFEIEENIMFDDYYQSNKYYKCEEKTWNKSLCFSKWRDFGC